jgi:cytidyltransferase-like protein
LKKIVLVSGGFDPLHSGHISYLNAAKALGDILIVAVNSDEWLRRKKGYNFLPWKERSFIVSNLSCVDKVIDFDDSIESASNAIYKCLEDYENVIFANGGDRQNTNCPELNDFINNDKVEFIFGVGGIEKLNSSSDIVKDFLARVKYTS